MTKTRRIERADYRHFPPEYVDLLTRFKHTGVIRLGPMTQRQAQSMRREWYRYASFLRSAPPDDDYACSLAAIASTMVWSVAPQEDIVGDLHNAWFLNAYLNPIVAAVRSSAPSLHHTTKEQTP